MNTEQVNTMKPTEMPVHQKVSSFTELALESHRIAKEKGWWNKPRSEASLIQLMVTELAEATEEVRSGKEPFYLVNGKPEGEAVEIADMLIRLGDFVAANESKIDLGVIDLPLEEPFACNPPLDTEDALSFHLHLTSLLISFYKHFQNEENEFDLGLEALTYQIVTKCHFYFQKKGWDLWYVINEKMAYNKGRPYRHGGKLF